MLIPDPELPPQLGAAAARQERRPPGPGAGARSPRQRHPGPVQRGGPGGKPAGPRLARSSFCRGPMGSSPPGNPGPSDSPRSRAPTPIADLRYRRPAKVAGRLRSVRIQPWADVPTLEGTLTDASGGECCSSSLGDGKIPGIRTGHPASRQGHGRRPPGPAGHAQPRLRASVSAGVRAGSDRLAQEAQPARRRAAGDGRG